MNFPAIDPVIFGFGSLQVRWYGLMYVLGFTACYFLVRKQIKEKNDGELAKQFENLNFVLILSVILGGRLGYVLFYNFPYYVKHPLEIFATWQGGMSFHGACFTLILVGFIFCKLKQLDFWKTADMYVVTIPIGLGLGRIGNFINAELYGRTTELPWGIIFPGAGPNPRHPSQLYEAFLEGLLLFILLWNMRKKTDSKSTTWPYGSMLSFFLIGYGFFRFLVEFAREPDPQVGFILGPFTMGQLLSSTMILGGMLLWQIRRIKQR